MSIYDYQVFNTVVQQGSFNKASRILHVTPSAVSHIIAKLETDLGFPLLIRNRNGVSLTSDGEKILTTIRELLFANEQLNQEISDKSGIITGEVSIAAFGSVALRWLPQIITNFKSDFPNITIRITQGTYAEVAGLIDSGAADLAFVTETYHAIDEVELLELHTEPLLCALPRSFKTKNSSIVSVKELKDSTLIHSSSGLSNETQEYIDCNGLKSEYTYILDDDHAKLAMVEKGLGVCIMPELCFDDGFDINVLPLEPAGNRTIYLAVAHSKFVSPAAAELKNKILEFAKDL